MDWTTPNRELDEMMNNLDKILAVEAAKAYLSPGTVAGYALLPYVTSTIRMDPSGVFVVSRPGSEYRTTDKREALAKYFEACVSELKALGEGPRLSQALGLINGPAVKAAEAYIASHQ